MLLASYARVCAAESRPGACRSVFHPVSRQTGRRAFRLVFRQTYPLVFHPVWYSAELRTSLSAATVSPAGRMGQRVDVLSGYRLRGEKKAEAAGWQDSWCAGHRFVHRLVHPAVGILVPIVLVRISGVPILLVWSEKKRAGVRKGVPWAEQSPQDGPIPDPLASAVLFDP
jgi:hypothetical protein